MFVAPQTSRTKYVTVVGSQVIGSVIRLEISMHVIIYIIYLLRIVLTAFPVAQMEVHKEMYHLQILL